MSPAVARPYVHTASGSHCCQVGSNDHVIGRSEATLCHEAIAPRFADIVLVDRQGAVMSSRLSNDLSQICPFLWF